MSLPDQNTGLMTAFQSIQQEYKRISDLLSLGPVGPLGQFAEPINSRFVDYMSEAQVLIDQIEQSLSKENLSEGWRLYVDLQSKLMPILSSELLAVIGGTYLIKQSLDVLGRQPGDTLSFSRIAQELADDLASRSGTTSGSVLIVGEERLGHSKSEIIRLRFPACDIWHLPFTAHEYGYLVAEVKAQVHQKLDPFRDLRARVRTSIDPTDPKNSTHPTDRDCFLKAVQDLWDVYEAKGRPDRDPFSKDYEEDFREPYGNKINQLANQQETHLCRLFADAFATFFVGPAYVYALLQLQFIPDKGLYEPTAALPPFAHRFAFALETLRWMSEKPILNPEDNKNAFQSEVDDSSGILYLWKQTTQSAQQPDRYKEIVTKYQPWLDIIWDSFEKYFKTDHAIGKTYKNWDEAKKNLKNPIIKLPLKLEGSPPQKWSVLNAAWAARWANPTQAPVIEKNVLNIFSNKDVEYIENTGDPRRSQGGTDQPGKPGEKEVAKRKVRRGLSGVRVLLERFNVMVDKNKIVRDEEMLQVLSEKDPKDPDYAYTAFQDLIDKRFD